MNNIVPLVFSGVQEPLKRGKPDSHIIRIKTYYFMDPQKVDMFIMTNGKNFESHQLIAIRERLLEMDDSKWVILQSIEFKEPTTCLIISILAGSLGIDRFFIGDTGLGIGKLLTCGGLGIWAIVDWFLIQGAAREKNMLKLQQIIY